MDVTVLVAACNRLPMLQQALCSAIAQSHPPDEVLVVDDGSDEPARRWLDEEARACPCLRVVHQANQGVAAARDTGLRAARGELVCILDSDDQLMPAALERIVAVFERDPCVDLVYTSYQTVMTDGSVRDVRLPRYEGNEAMLRATLIRPRVPFKHSGTTFRRRTALELGGYDVNLPMKVDIDLFLKFLSAGKRLQLIDEPLVRFLFHGQSISRDRRQGIRTWCGLIDRYGPPQRLRRAWFKLLRGAAETLKGGYERLCLR